MKIKNNNKKLKIKLIVFLYSVLLLIILIVSYTLIHNSSETKNNPTLQPTNNRTVDDHNSNEPKNENISEVQKPPINTTPIKPSGTFVSNHNPNLSGYPSPNLISSTCNTTPGATCEIIFKLNSISRSLPPKNTDSYGNAYWDWNLKDLDLFKGEWTITARASIGQNISEENDAIKLNIKD